MDRKSLSLSGFIVAMAAIVAASNVLVQHPVRAFGLDNVLTWGALTYPIAFLVNDLANRRLGLAAARKVVLAGFVLAVILSVWLATPRIAVASGAAFLVAQLLDASIFDALRRQAWWRAPFISTMIGSVLDTVLFFSIAFAASFAFIDAWSGLPDGSLVEPVVSVFGTVPLWASLALGDFVVKVAVGLAMLVPYGAALRLMMPTARA